MDPKNKHGLALLEQLWTMREMGELTDVVLVVEDVYFPCHRVVLCAFSPYFRVMFTCGLSECSQREVVLRDTPAESLGLLLDYMYLAELPLTNTNVQGVSTAAFLLQMDDVFKQCQQHMIDHMDASNCLGVYYYARELGAEELADLAQRYLRQHFAEVCLQEEVMELEAHQLLPLVGSDDLNITREESILDMVLRWVDHRRAERATHLAELLRRVRLPLVAPDFLREARRRSTVLLGDAECLEMVEQALEAARQHPAAAPRRLKLRYGMETTDVLLCIGNDGQGIRSRQGSYCDYSFCYAASTGRTLFITSPRYGEVLGCVCAGVVTEDNQIVVAGEAGARRMARQKNRTVDICRYKASAQGTWEKLCSVEYRDMYALGTLGDTLYLLGGQMKLKNHYLITNSVERWSLKGGPWRNSAPLPMPLACHCVVSLKGCLYVLGGRTPQCDRPDDEPDRLSNRMFQYDPEANKWEERGSMKFSKYRCSAVVLNGEIYVLGGIGCEGADRGQSRRCLDVVEIYNPDGGFWREGPRLPYPLLSLRSGASNAGAAGGKLYVCGFYRGADRHDAIIKDIIELDPWEKVWTMVARRVLMHDNYDVCLVANLNPRNLVAPPSDASDE
ncbi:kelch repeat and BTB domain-containing protein 12 [Brienomyrus brachyistius]|uniref:kelch repeat and BTB domain-containing protein 12 n=1 Tax=Brienomyrus brachyistius TaxID=42636 RepID=UPI0020B3F66B|nr:kelch repeat and BTB domain-containing protein 12 [Brienomyrus brachyistius]XP_048877965.1 kelch repeat and BTB domain-containing protein 12 [Brienomyrus brachyistius]XP_048877966.1 kelch repeat and BTB domain-containing protein 12 [Brienomyrus brachyistius]XP_048877967.1 kelch repeat and BTB domain-containing protein 12 [Brienomyrus brachyistius]